MLADRQEEKPKVRSIFKIKFATPFPCTDRIQHVFTISTASTFFPQETRLRSNYLKRHFHAFNNMKGGAQNVVPGDNASQRRLHQPAIQMTLDRDYNLAAQDAGSLLLKPHAPLMRRQGKAAQNSVLHLIHL